MALIEELKEITNGIYVLTVRHDRVGLVLGERFSLLGELLLLHLHERVRRLLTPHHGDSTVRPHA